MGWLLVAAAVIFNLWILRAQAIPVTYSNDSGVHLSMVDWATERIQAGHLPFDGWFPNLAAGSAQFHHYQSLPHIITGFLGVFFGPQATFAFSLYLLLALWPLCIYWTVRLLGWDPWTAGAAAVVSPLLMSAFPLDTVVFDDYGFELGAYVRAGWGMWSQLWGMWLLPLAVALTWRALARNGSLLLAALAIAMTAACHYMTAYLAFLAVGAFILIRPSELLRRLKRGAIVVGAALTMAAWVLVPLLLDRRWYPKDEWLADTYHDSFGAKRVLTWFFTGRILDGVRLPIITTLMLVGVLVCLARWRRDEVSRVPIVLFAIGLLMFFGRPTLGPVLDLLPASEELFLHRYIIGVHLAGIVLAGVGTAWLGHVAFEAARRRVFRGVRAEALVAALVVILLVVLSPAWRERALYASEDGRLIDEQRAADATDGRDLASLLEHTASSGPGRVYAGSLFTDWAYEFFIGHAVVLTTLVQSGADSIGYSLRVGAITTPVEPRFDEADPTHYDLFNVRYLILPEGMQPPVQAELAETAGPFALWHVPTHGYIQVVDILGPPIVADRTNIGPKTEPFLDSGLAGRGVYRSLAFAGAPGAPATTTETDPATPPGTVTSVSGSLEQGTISADVLVDRPSAVLLKASFDPRWRVIIDGAEVEAQMFAPSFVGLEVSAGRHRITFTYVPFPRYDLLLAIAFFTFLAFPSAGAIRRRRRRRIDED